MAEEALEEEKNGQQRGRKMIRKKIFFTFEGSEARHICETKCNNMRYLQPSFYDKWIVLGVDLVCFLVSHERVILWMTLKGVENILFAKMSNFFKFIEVL